MNNNKKQSNLQFTELTPDDIAVHEDIYINILVDLALKVIGFPLSNIPARLYYEYAIKEVQKANDLFQETFG